jgi:hypothetical protein
MVLFDIFVFTSDKISFVELMRRLVGMMTVALAT